MYYGQEEIEAAKKRGEQILEMSAQLAQLQEQTLHDAQRTLRNLQRTQPQMSDAERAEFVREFGAFSR